MSALDGIAYFQGRRDEVPNQELAKALAEANDNGSVQSDCLKALHEIGYLDPELIADYVEEFGDARQILECPDVLR